MNFSSFVNYSFISSTLSVVTLLLLQFDHGLSVPVSVPTKFRLNNKATHDLPQILLPLLSNNLVTSIPVQLQAYDEEIDSLSDQTHIVKAMSVPDDDASPYDMQRKRQVEVTTERRPMLPTSMAFPQSALQIFQHLSPSELLRLMNDKPPAGRRISPLTVHK